MRFAAACGNAEKSAMGRALGVRPMPFACSPGKSGRTAPSLAPQAEQGVNAPSDLRLWPLVGQSRSRRTQRRPNTDVCDRLDKRASGKTAASAGKWLKYQSGNADGPRDS